LTPHLEIGMDDYLRLSVMREMRQMSSDGLLEVIRSGEGQTVEFKARFTTEVGKTICAFANTTGGIILLSISDDRNVKGISGDME